MHTAYKRSTIMNGNSMVSYVKEVLKNIPADWLKLTTHRLDIYNEKEAKNQFLGELEVLYKENNAQTSALSELPTAYDYIRLGHPLSCLLEWVVADINKLDAESVISFSSKTTPVLAVLRKNLLDKKKTQVLYTGKLPFSFNADAIRRVYGYSFDLKKVAGVEDVPEFDGSTVLISPQEDIFTANLTPAVDFFISTHAQFGSVLLINGAQNIRYVSDIQHVRRRETIAMTPANCLAALRSLTGLSSDNNNGIDVDADKAVVEDAIKKITGVDTKALLGSSGLSIQYAIMMGLIDHALENHPEKDIKIIVPPNCYGGTNDQARRVAACIDKVEVLDLPVDGGNDMVQGVETVLAKVAEQDAVPYIIAEIPTNPRVEVPDLIKLQEALERERKTANGDLAIDPVFILDQTFCPNVHFLGEGEVLSTVRTISYSSGSKFPSGGLCTAGYCVGNKQAESLMDKVEAHLVLCDNEATDHQIEILAKQLPSMKQRITDAYKNTREFVRFVEEVLPEAKINFVSEELAAQGFTPSVFSLGLPTKGNTPEEQEAYKRALNLKLINLMITEIPDESKYCVSYGQLKGCYWTVPATSTQGTTKEGDKDYIVRVAMSPNMDLERHKEVFLRFVTDQ